MFWCRVEANPGCAEVNGKRLFLAGNSSNISAVLLSASRRMRRQDAVSGGRRSRVAGGSWEYWKKNNKSLADLSDRASFSEI